MKSLKLAQGGEIFIPKLPSYKILDLAKAVAPTAKIKVIGIGQGEKIDEELITKSGINSLEFKDFYVIFQVAKVKLEIDILKIKGKRLKITFPIILEIIIF